MLHINHRYAVSFRRISWIHSTNCKSHLCPCFWASLYSFWTPKIPPPFFPLEKRSLWNKTNELKYSSIRQSKNWRFFGIWSRDFGQFSPPLCLMLAYIFSTVKERNKMSTFQLPASNICARVSWSAPVRPSSPLTSINNSSKKPMVTARHSTMTSSSVAKSGITSTVCWPFSIELFLNAASPLFISASFRVSKPVSTSRPPFRYSGSPVRSSVPANRICNSRLMGSMSE